MTDKEVMLLMGIVVVSCIAVVLLGLRQISIDQHIDNTQQRLERTEQKLNGILKALDNK